MNIEGMKQEILLEFTNVFSVKDFSSSLGVAQKSDQTIVTQLDNKISALFERECLKRSKRILSEENDYRRLDFPMAVLDPIDGTKELAMGIPECSVSYVELEDEKIEPKEELEAWIFNPFTGFDLRGNSQFMMPPKLRVGRLLGLVSQTEYDAHLFDLQKLAAIDLAPRGSIAYKLGLLAIGACDFVVSKRPKNIWDIAAGTMICEQRGIHFYCEDRRVKNWDAVEFKAPFLLWTREENLAKLCHLFR